MATQRSSALMNSVKALLLPSLARSWPGQALVALVGQLQQTVIMRAQDLAQLLLHHVGQGLLLGELTRSR